MKEKLKNFFFKPKSLDDAFEWLLTTVAIVFGIVLLLIFIFNFKEVLLAILSFIVTMLVLAIITYVFSLLLQTLANTTINTYNYFIKKKLKK